MCNCGCDPDTKSEADKLKRQGVISASSVAALAGIPAVVNSTAHPHHAVMFAVIGVQLVLIANALRLFHKRSQLLARA